MLKKLKALDDNGNQSSQISINIKTCLDSYNACKDYWEFVESLEDMFSTIHYVLLIINAVWNDIQILLTFKKYFTDKMYTFMVLRETGSNDGSNYAVSETGLEILRTFLTRSSLLRNPRTIGMLNRNADIKVTELNEKDLKISQKISSLTSSTQKEEFIKKMNRINQTKAEIANNNEFLKLISRVYKVSGLICK
jgi:hypothetical protein